MNEIPNKQRLIQKVIERFDFQRMCDIMTILNWKWNFMAVPTVDELIERAYSLLEEAADKFIKFGAKEDVGISTGGFEVIVGYRNYGADDKLTMQLRFVTIDSYVTENEEE